MTRGVEYAAVADRRPSARPSTDTALRGWVAIIEPNFSGHRWRYADWVAQACREAGERCIIVTDRAFADHPFTQRIVSNADPHLRIEALDLFKFTPSVFNHCGVHARFHRLFAQALADVRREVPVRLVIVPFADYFFYMLGLRRSPFGSTDWIGLVMGATFHHSRVGVRTPRRPLVDWAKRVLFTRAMRDRRLKVMLTIDPTLPRWFDRNHASARAAPLEYVADPFPDTPAEDPQRARERLGLDPHARYLLVYGAISGRKGVRELVQALAQQADAPVLLIAGEQDTETRAFLAAHLPRLAHAPVVLDRFIPEDVERALFSACDAVWLGYKHHYGMSGVLVQAYRFGKPVIATADGLIGWFCRDGQLGPRIDDLTPASIALALDALSRRWSGRAAGEATPVRDSLLERNTLDQFKHSFQQAVIATRA
ncbi:MAG TPA: glycosyltransferase [Paraburkholderia sp.]|nr:glycosyltransferase [Paraburkholderia sp.]